MAKSPYETYEDWERRTFCDNASRRGTGIGVRQCVDGKREFECTVIYNEVDSDTMVLCSECKETLKKEARKHGYNFRSKPISLESEAEANTALAYLDQDDKQGKRENLT